MLNHHCRCGQCRLRRYGRARWWWCSPEGWSRKGMLTWYCLVRGIQRRSQAWKLGWGGPSWSTRSGLLTLREDRFQASGCSLRHETVRSTSSSFIQSSNECYDWSHPTTTLEYAGELAITEPNDAEHGERNATIDLSTAAIVQLWTSTAKSYGTKHGFRNDAANGLTWLQSAGVCLRIQPLSLRSRLSIAIAATKPTRIPTIAVARVSAVRQIKGRKRLEILTYAITFLWPFSNLPKIK